MGKSLFDTVKTDVIFGKYRKAFRYFACTVGCIVAFAATYALILPAFTMERKSFCGYEEHSHSKSCYSQQAERRDLICNISGFGLHSHSGGCYDEEGTVICGQADYVVHSHNESCRNGEGALVCTLPERAQHVHSGSCYRTQEPTLHTHTDACKVPVKGSLICEIQEYPGHQHGEDCYRAGSRLQCTREEGHSHGDGCYEYPLVCGKSVEPHVHGDSCYTRGGQICQIPENHAHEGSCYVSNLSCGQTEFDHTHGSDCFRSALSCGEEHEHTDGCYRQEKTCGLSEGGHRHSDSCYTLSAVCSTPEGHVHGSGCYERILGCAIAEGEAHVHDGGCYSTERRRICTLDENHIHENACYQQELACETPESAGHSHEDGCYQWEDAFGCGLEDGQPEKAEPVLVCREPAAQVHVHTDGCFAVAKKEDTVCGLNHKHTDSCYALKCSLQEHTHCLQCYSNPHADVENKQTWEKALEKVEKTGDWNLDVVAIAESQLGYRESTRNYTVWEDDSVHGYTRYGAWYGVPNGDWCGMFASFCLDYAGVEGVPYNYGVRPWIEDLSALDLYRTAEEYTPIPGDLVFFDWDRQDGLSDHVGIVYEVIAGSESEKAQLKTIEGNSSNCVQFVTYDLDSVELLGYSMLPENPEITYLCGLHKHVHNKKDCFDEENLICEEAVHIHSKDCLVEMPEEVTVSCGEDGHIHTSACQTVNRDTLPEPESALPLTSDVWLEGDGGDKTGLNVTGSLGENGSIRMQVQEVWEGDGRELPVTVYLLADGVRFREETLSSDNGWQHTWTDLPTHETGTEAEITYTVEAVTGAEFAPGNSPAADAAGDDAQEDDLLYRVTEEPDTLVTCTPVGINSQRLRALKYRFETSEGAAALSVAAGAVQIAPVVVAPFLAAPLLLLILLMLPKRLRT